MTARMEGQDRLDELVTPVHANKIKAMVEHRRAGDKSGQWRPGGISIAIVVALGGIVLGATAGAQWFGQELREESRQSVWSKKDGVSASPRMLRCAPGDYSAACQAVIKARLSGPKIIFRQPGDNADIPAVRFD